MKRNRSDKRRLTAGFSGWQESSNGPELSEGLPVPREPAYAAKRSQDGEAPAASE
jgi:uncharacterized protein YbbK (DUF523 family)